MICSPSRLEDQRIRMMMLEVMEISLRHGDVDNARSIGESSAKLKRRIDTHDYKVEDKWHGICSK
jgi:hypothetical protein